MTDVSGDNNVAPKMTLWDHTRELSSRVKIILYSIFIGTVLMLALPANLNFLKNPIEFYDPLIGVILRTIKDQILPPYVTLIGVDFTAPIQLYVIASFVFGVAVSMPVIALQAYKFIDPALYPHERKDIYPFVTTFTILFAVGAFFGYRVLTILIIRAMLPFYPVVGAEPIISVLDFYNMVFITVLISGVSFTIPVFFVILVKYNIVSTKIVSKNRLYIYAGLYAVCAFVTPDGGPGSLIMMMPIVVLMELGVLFAKRYEKGRESKPRLQIFNSQTCKFCRSDISTYDIFCENCGKSQK